MAVLWAQWLGLEHAVVHGFGPVHYTLQTGRAATPGMKPKEQSADYGLSALFGDTDFASSTRQGSSTAHHSCAAFDTATLGASAPATLLAQPVCPFHHIQADHRIPEFYLPLFAALFNSRAPPLFSHPS